MQPVSSECCATEWPLAQCSHTAVARKSHNPQSQMEGACGTDKSPSIIAHDHLPITGGDQPASPLMEIKKFTAPHSSLCRIVISCFPWYWSVLRKNSSRDISTGWKPLLPSGTALSQPRMLRHQSLETAAHQLQWSVQMHWPCQNSRLFPEIPYSLSQTQPTLCFHHAL